MLQAFLPLILACGIFGTLAIPSENINLLKLFELRSLGLDFYKNITSLDSIVKSENVDAKCLTQLQAIENDLLRNLWSIKLIDAWGKVPSGILYGNLIEMGNYDECLGIKHNIGTSELHGKYCLGDISIGQIRNATEIPKFRIGICIPAACKAEQLSAPLEEVLAKILDTTALGITNTAVLLKEKSCSTADKITFEAIDWIAISILSIIAAFMIASTIYDYLATYNGNPVHTLFGSFSVRTNMRQLFHISTHNNAPHNIPCLHGLRCMSLIWVVYIHTYNKMTRPPHANINNIELEAWSRTLYSNLWQGGIMAVDTFFFLSGILIITVAFRQMAKDAGRINVPNMFMHRYLRLTPVLALAVLLHMSIIRYMGNGPVREKVDQICIDNWWATLLYVQNYATAGKMCLAHSWYLAVDMQLYLISPLILTAIWKWKRKALAGLSLLGLLLAAALFCIIVVDNLSVLEIFGLFPDPTEVMFKIYFSTHTRAIPWIVGVVFGYYLHCRAGKRSILAKSTIALGWLCALGLILIVTFAMHPKKQLDATALTSVEGAFYLSLSHIAWPLALSWIVFACVNGFGGPIDPFLSSALWQPLSKLSYCFYIWHTELVRINAQRIKTNMYLSDYDGILRFWGDFGMSLLVSILIYLAIESPMQAIDKYLFMQKIPKPNYKEGNTIKDKTMVSEQKPMAVESLI